MKENSEKEKVGNEMEEKEKVDEPDPGDAGFGVPGGEEPIGW